MAEFRAIDVADSAKERILQILEKDQKSPEEYFVRVSVTSGGCSGLSYSLEFDNEVGKHDKKFDIDGVPVVVDSKSYLYLNGTTLDFVTEGLQSGFAFVNPQAKSTCGCGTSFSA